MSEPSLADALFNPRAVALVGASGDARKNTARPQRFLKNHGYKGRILPINPGRDEVLGEQSYPDIASAPGPVDHALIMVPGAAVPEVIDDCRRAGVKIATIYSDGFAETGEDGARRQTEIVALARDAGLRLIGPNSMGVIDTHNGSAITVNAALEAPGLISGNISVASHSGTILGTLISRGAARGIGFSKMISLGNECDLGVGEITDLLVDDPNTETILLFLETIRDPDALARAARRAYEAGKPVIAYKLGRSDAGRRLAVSHSGAIAGSDAAADAFFRHHGIVRVNMLETLFEIPPLLAGAKVSAGKRVAVLTTTGGGAATVVDRLGALGVETVSAPQSLVDSLAAKGIDVGASPVIDLTMAGARGEIYGPALSELLNSPDCDAVVAVVGSSAQFHAEVAVEPILVAGKHAQKPLAVFLVPQADESLSLLQQAGISAFRTPEACADGLRACLGRRAPTPKNKIALAGGVEAAITDASAPILNAVETETLFDVLDIPRSPSQLIKGPGEASKIGYPVAAKIVSGDIAHKTEAGGIVLNIADNAALDDASARILASARESFPDAEISGILLQPMESGLAEALVGYRDNPETGPIVMVGVGGVLAEIYADVAIRLAPVDKAAAREMIDEVKGMAPIRGYRGLPEGDCAALADAIVRLSTLALVPGEPVMEAEINPVIVRRAGEGVVAVDGLVALKEA